MFVNNSGNIDNYNSFNYSYNNGVLTLNNDLIISYQEMTANQYAHLIKNIS